jgi:FlaA1/EpsC-like NDP-sugar epimerase
VRLILVEGAALFAAVATTVFVWGQPHLLDWLDVASLMGQAAIFSLCCIVAFYYNDLYDLRIVRSFGEFATRLLQGLGVALLLLAGFYTIAPDMRAGNGALLSSVLVIVALLLPIRAVGYFIVRRRAFSDRVLIVGTGPLARKIMEEIEARPHYR